MFCILLTDDVSHPETSRVSRERHCINMTLMSSTDDVSHPETSTDLREERPPNMPDIFFTPETSTLLRSSDSIGKPANRELQFSGKTTPSSKTTAFIDPLSA